MGYSPHCRWCRGQSIQALGREDIISRRTGLYLLMVGLSVTLAIGAVTLGRRITRRLGTGNATLISAGLYLAGIAAAMWL